MFQFQPDEKFEPSTNTKEWWLYTHKTKINIAGVSMPGLFQTTNYEWQVIGFFAIFFLEGLATYWAFYEGIAITAILALIFIDIVLAILSHLPYKKLMKSKNEEVYETGEEQKKTKTKINRSRNIINFWSLTIIISALTKFYFFYSEYQIVDSISLFVFTCYILGAILHITCTGFAIFTTIFKIKINKEHSDYIQSVGVSYAFDPNDPKKGEIDSELVLEETRTGLHEIKKIGEKFFFITQGVLTDQELREMISRQIKLEQKRVVAVEGIKHQVSILKS